MSTNEAETKDENSGENRSGERIVDTATDVAQEDEEGIEEGNPRLFNHQVDILLHGMPTSQ